MNWISRSVGYICLTVLALFLLKSCVEATREQQADKAAREKRCWDNGLKPQQHPMYDSRIDCVSK